jgi:hypothetical protein
LLFGVFRVHPLLALTYECDGCGDARRPEHDSCAI